jgi:FimV-like protein
LLVVLTWLLLRRRDDEPHALDANSMSMNHMNSVSPSAPLMHDLNAMNTNAVDDTEMSKLKLATQLLTTGEVDLASALLKSVAASSSGDLQARAQRMLATIQ